MSRGATVPPVQSLRPQADGSRFVPMVNGTLPVRRVVKARLAALRRRLLAQLCLDRERQVRGAAASRRPGPSPGSRASAAFPPPLTPCLPTSASRSCRSPVGDCALAAP